MSQFHETLQEAHDQLLFSDEELAVNALTQEVSDAARDLEGAQSSRNFTRGYSPTPPGPRPHPEAGGMDHQDWAAEAYEYHNYDVEEELASAEGDVDRAYRTLSELTGLKRDIDAGDQEAINEVAAFERNRLLEVISQAQRREAQKGAEFAGGKELFDAVQGLIDNGEAIWNSREQVGPDGWQYPGYRPSWGGYSKGYSFVQNKDGGALASRGSWSDRFEIMQTPVFEGRPAVTVHYQTIPEDAVISHGRNSREAHGSDYYELTIHGDGRVSHQRHFVGKSSQASGHGYQRIDAPTSTGFGTGNVERDLVQDDVDLILGLAHEISGDIKALQTA